MNIKTHHKTCATLVGTPLEVGNNFSRVFLTATDQMAVDDTGLIHGGFIFGLADYAAMLAVNHPNVVLGAADARFLKPVKVGEGIIAEASVEPGEGKKRMVTVRVLRGEDCVFTGVFTCFTLDRHVLAPSD